MGWLGWSEEQTLYSDVNAILLGFEGKIEYLKVTTGGGTDDEKSLPPWVRKARAKLIEKQAASSPARMPAKLMTPAAFDAKFTNRINLGPRRPVVKRMTVPTKS